jgi:hypothetical protein
MASLPSIPNPGEPLRASWARDVALCIREQLLSAGPGLRMTRTPSGTTLSLAATPKTVASTAAASAPRPWDLAIDGATLTARAPVFMIGPSWFGMESGSITATAGTATAYYVYAKINLLTHDAALYLDESDINSSPDENFALVPLYLITRPDADSSFSVAFDFRGMPQLAVYL